MRCHFSNDEEANSVPPAVNIWSSSSIPTLSLVKTIDNPNGTGAGSFPHEISSVCSLDVVSVPHKRKILECEKEDFHERLQKIQRKIQLQCSSEVENMSVDDDDNDEPADENSDEVENDDKGDVNMEWISQDYYNANSWDTENLSFENIKKCPVLCKSKKLKDDRWRLLKISMAKIRGVEDPETYLRRSVLINNTVKRLQKDNAVNYKCYTSTSSMCHEKNVDQWQVECSNIEVTCKELNAVGTTSFDFENSDCSNDNGQYNYSEVQTDITYSSMNFQLPFAFSSDKSVDNYQLEVLPSIHSSFFNKNSLDEEKLNETSRALKSSSSMHVLSSQSCGFQYRNMQNEETKSEYSDSSGSTSILDSVVYHSLIASLES